MKRSFAAFMDDLHGEERGRVPRGRAEERGRWMRDGEGGAAGGGDGLVVRSQDEELGEEKGEDGANRGTEVGREDAGLLEKIQSSVAAVNAGLESGLEVFGVDRTVGSRTQRASREEGGDFDLAGRATVSVVEEYLNELEGFGTRCPGPDLDDEDDMPVSEVRCCGAPGVVRTEEMQREIEAVAMMPLPDDSEEEGDGTRAEEGEKWVWTRVGHGI